MLNSDNIFCEVVGHIERLIDDEALCQLVMQFLDAAVENGHKISDNTQDYLINLSQRNSNLPMSDLAFCILKKAKQHMTLIERANVALTLEEAVEKIQSLLKKGDTSVSKITQTLKGIIEVVQKGYPVTLKFFAVLEEILDKKVLTEQKLVLEVIYQIATNKQILPETLVEKLKDGLSPLSDSSHHLVVKILIEVAKQDGFLPSSIIEAFESLFLKSNDAMFEYLVFIKLAAKRKQLKDFQTIYKLINLLSHKDQKWNCFAAKIIYYIVRNQPQLINTNSDILLSAVGNSCHEAKLYIHLAISIISKEKRFILMSNHQEELLYLLNLNNDDDDLLKTYFFNFFDFCKQENPEITLDEIAAIFFRLKNNIDRLNTRNINPADFVAVIETISQEKIILLNTKFFSAVLKYLAQFQCEIKNKLDLFTALAPLLNPSTILPCELVSIIIDNLKQEEFGSICIKMLVNIIGDANDLSKNDLDKLVDIMRLHADKEIRISVRTLLKRIIHLAKYQSIYPELSLIVKKEEQLYSDESESATKERARNNS